MEGWKHVGTKEIPGWGSPAVLRVRTSGARSLAEFPKWASAMMGGFNDELEKIARDMPSFLDQNRSKGVKKVYRGLSKPKAVADLKKRYGARWEEVKARIAAKQGKSGKQPVGPPYSPKNF
jgi:hypothetical protein